VGALRLTYREPSSAMCRTVASASVMTMDEVIRAPFIGGPIGTADGMNRGVYGSLTG
jgi:hypothetical protein